MPLPFDQQQFNDAEEGNQQLRAAVSQLRDQQRFASAHGNMLSPQHQHRMLGPSGLRPGPGGPSPHQNPNLAATIMNMISSPNAGSIPPGFNPYRQHQSPHQSRFPQYMTHGYPSGPEMSFSQSQQPARHHPSFSYAHSPVHSPEDLRKRAAQAQAQAQVQGYFPYGSQRHLNQPPPGMLSNRNSNSQNLGIPPGGFGHEGPNPGLTNSMGMTAMSGSPTSSNVNQPQFNGSMGAGAGMNVNTAPPDSDALDGKLEAEEDDGGDGVSGEESGSSQESEGGKKKVQQKRDGSSLPWPPPAGDKEYSLSEIINSLASGNRLSESARGRGKGRGRGRGRGRGKGKAIMSLTKTGPDGTIIPIHSAVLGSEDNKNSPVWYSGSVSLGLEEDQYWLSELQVFLRSNFAEAFGATESDIAAPMHGRNKPIALGQVGIRCIHCKTQAPAERGQQAVSYPSLISGIYNSVQQMFRLHFDCCTNMPADVRTKIETLRSSSSSRGGRKQYWVDSAKRLGLVDTPHGIHFGRDPSGPLPPLEGPSAKMIGKKDKENDDDGFDVRKHDSPIKPGSLLSQEHSDEMKRQKEEAYPLVLADDKPLISDYLFLTLEQMEPCKLMDADRVGCYKGRVMGFRGLACKWCVGQAGCGRYFPASEASLSQTTTSQTILNHVRNCRRCPTEIRDKLELMKSSKTGPDGKKFDKPKHGGRKVFFHRLWCRIQDVPINEFENVEAKIGRQKGAKNKRMVRKAKAKASKRKRQAYHGSSTESDSDSNGDETETDEEDKIPKKVGRPKKKTKTIQQKPIEDDVSIEDEGDTMSEENVDVINHGYVALSKNDDVHWLSELQCFVRAEMIEIFSVQEGDLELEDEDIIEGQVGIRCAYCAKLPADERPDGHAYFPRSLSTIYQNASDLQRRHFLSCNEIPDDARKSFKSLRGFAAKAEGETQQYWIDSARELGVANYDGRSGIRFSRDPTTPSPADLLEKEQTKARKNGAADKTSLLRASDVATDHTYLLMQQVRPCQFKNGDRRGGPGSRGRDRALGFPGIACRHCSSKNNFGRYFPVAPKSLADNTANTIQAHMTSCSRCPTAVKSSLAYLSHRAQLQKIELGGGWKKTFFKLVWDRLHVERAWSRAKAKPQEERVEENESSAGENDGNNEDSDHEEVDELVKAAATWITNRDAQAETSVVPQSSRTKASRGRGLPSRKRRDSVPS